MNLTPEQITAILDEAKPSIIDGLRKEVIRQAHWQVTDVAGKLIQEEVTEFVKNVVIPEVKIKLAESRESILSSAVACAETVATALCTSLTTSLAKKLESSYSREQIFKALFQ